MRPAALCAALAALVYLAAVNVPGLERADLQVLTGFMGLPRTELAVDLAGLFDPAPFAVLAASVALAGVALGRAKEGVAAFALMLGANVTTQILKPLLAVQRDYPPFHVMGPEAWPSGHTTAVMSFALALLIVSPPRLRPLAAAFGGLLTVATVYSILMLGWHYPSDIVGGLLIATAWACLVARGDARVSVSGPVAAGVLLAGAGAFAVFSRPEAALAYAAANTTFVAGALAIAGAALVLSGSVPVPRAARRDRSHPARG